MSPFISKRKQEETLYRETGVETSFSSIVKMTHKTKINQGAEYKKHTLCIVEKRKICSNFSAAGARGENTRRWFHF